MTNREFGEHVGVDHTTASRLRSGKRLPSCGLFIRIVTTFDLDWDKAAKAYLRGSDAFGALLRDYVFKDRVAH